MKTMAEVLTGKTFGGRQLNERQIAEIADALTEAGYGPVKSAGAQAWDAGFATGKSRAMRHMSDEPNLPFSAPNPYRDTK